ncbi:MAG: DUF998 domain-containing protein [Paracoccaceae bacterium]
METVAATLYVLDLLILLSFQVLEPQLGLFRHAVSEYALGRRAGLFRAYMLTGGLAAPVLAWQFLRATGPDYPGAIPVYLLLVALGRMVLGWFPVDRQGDPHTAAGQVHHAATFLAFACAYMAVAEATPLMAATMSDAKAAALGGLKHAISLGFVAVVVTMSPPLRRFFGLAERLFLYATGLWFLAATLTLPPL